MNGFVFVVFAIFHIAIGLFELNQEQSKFTEKFINVVRCNFIGIRSMVFLYEESQDDHIIDDLIGDHPFYNIRMTREGVTKFNGIYNYVYDDFITFEESKLYLFKASQDTDFPNAVRAMRRIYFWRTRDKIIIIINEKINHSIMVRTLSSFYILNVIFIYPNGSVFTYDKLMDREFFQLEDKNYFYNKMNDFRKLQIRISMFEHVRDAIPSKTGNYYDGRDGLLARSFMDFINATGIYIKPADGVDYGENKGHRNVTAITGAFGDVARNRTDVALNSRFMKNEFENVVEYTYPHDRDDLVILVPSGNADSKFEYDKSFEGVVWLIVVVCNFFFLVIFITTHTFDNIAKAMLYTFGIFLGQSYSYTNTKLGKLLIFIYTLYSFLIVVHYLSLLMSIITVPHKPKEIDTFDDLAKSKLKMYTVERYKRYLIWYGEDSVKRLKDRIFIASENEVLQLIDAHGDYAVICKRSVADWAIVQRHNYKEGTWRASLRLVFKITGKV